jgi:hypothetical protein
MQALYPGRKDCELQINVITWIGVPDEACDLYKKLTISPKPWVAPFKKRERRRRTRASFEASMLWT